MSTRLLELTCIEVPVQVRISGDAAASAWEAARSAWGVDGSAADEVAPEAGEAVESGSRELVYTVEDDSEIPTFLDRLSSQATLAAITERAGELLMLHAAGLELPGSGAVIACVAPSGTGKTTLCRSAAGLLDYVTDETVAVALSGTVIPYPKPLSVKPPDRAAGTWAPKQQLHPDAVGLNLSVPRAQMQLAGIVLLNRVDPVTSDGDSVEMDPVETGTVSFEAVDPITGILELVPEVSYLGRMDAPLQRIAEQIERVGGVFRLTYREASDALRALITQHPAWASSSETGEVLGGTSVSGRLVPQEEFLRASNEECDVWRTCAAGSTLSATSDAETLLRTRASVTDVVVDVSRGFAAAFLENRVYRLSAVGAAALVAAQNGISREGLHRFLVQIFGPPPVDPSDDVSESTRVAQVIDGVIDELTGQGLLDGS